jgi:hypothetical protein
MTQLKNDILHVIEKKKFGINIMKMNLESFGFTNLSKKRNFFENK